MRLMTKVLLGIVATGTVVAVAMTGTVGASHSAKSIDSAATAATMAVPVSARIETSPITPAEVLPTAGASEVGYFIGTGDGNGVWVQR